MNKSQIDAITACLFWNNTSVKGDSFYIDYTRQQIAENGGSVIWMDWLYWEGKIIREHRT